MAILIKTRISRGLKTRTIQVRISTVYSKERELMLKKTTRSL